VVENMEWMLSGRKHGVDVDGKKVVRVLKRRFGYREVWAGAGLSDERARMGSWSVEMGDCSGKRGEQLQTCSSWGTSTIEHVYDWH